MLFTSDHRNVMHVISYRRLREFQEQHSDCTNALDNWFKVASKADWANLVEVQATFPQTEAVGNFTVFNIEGNKYRLIVSIDYSLVLTMKGNSFTPSTFSLMLSMTRRNGKMTLTFDSDRYQKLLSQYQPKLIKTEEENEKALSIVEELMHRSNRTPEETALYKLLITLIEKFEREYYQPNDSTPESMLRFLMKQHQLEPKDLVRVFGSEDAVSAVLQQNQEISTPQAKALGKLFHVEAGLFI